MSERALPDLAVTAPGDPLTHRRVFFTAVVLASMAGLIWLLAFALSAGGFGLVDLILVVLFAVTLPWSVIGFWNATIGLFIMRAADPVAAVTPVAARVTGTEPITAKAAILWCVRNEDTERVIRNMEPMMEGLVASNAAAQFHVFILSDTNYPEVAAIEEPRFAQLASKYEGRLAVTYRRRTDNTGFKAGNIFDFCTRWGADCDPRRHARCGLIPDRGVDPAHGAHHAGRAEARNPAEPRGRPALDQRVRAHFPIRHAARHALLHTRQRVVAR